MTAVLETAVYDVEDQITGAAAGWHRVCAVADLEPAWGEAALIAGGITGSRGDRPTVASPLHKEVYDLGTGECLGSPELRLATFGTRIVGGYIEVQL